MSRARLAFGFAAGTLTYLFAFGTCLGTEAGNLLGSSCSAIGPILKLPLLVAVPYAGSKFLGVDSALLLLTLNATTWGALGAVVAGLIAKGSRSRQSRD